MLSRTSLFNRHSSGIWLIILAIGVFLIGILTYLASNHAQMDARLLAIDIGTVISLIITGTLLMAKVISKRKAIIIFTLTVAAEVCLSIIFESINPLPESVERVMLLVTLCFFPALMSKLAGSYTCQVIVSVAAIISYITASFLLDCVIMYRVLPVYVAIHICILIISRYLQPAKDINDGEPEELGVPQIEHLLKLEPDKWHLLKQSRLNHTEVKKVVTGMGRKM